MSGCGNFRTVPPELLTHLKYGIKHEVVQLRRYAKNLPPSGFLSVRFPFGCVSSHRYFTSKAMICQYLFKFFVSFYGYIPNED